MIEKLKAAINNDAPQEALQLVCNAFEHDIVFTTSFGLEDQVITDMIFMQNLKVQIAAIDTGRLFEETYKVFHSTLQKYQKNIDVFYPKTSEVEKLLSQKGPYSFYESIENRKECCNIRKVEPLQRILKGAKCWITGIRADQSSERNDMQILEWDEGYAVYKFNPLMAWTQKEVEEYLNQNSVPYNSLHNKGFVSIGCAPCTRAIDTGEDFRAGRWWWEQNTGKECGLHTHGE